MSARARALLPTDPDPEAERRDFCIVIQGQGARSLTVYIPTNLQMMKYELYPGIVLSHQPAVRAYTGREHKRLVPVQNAAASSSVLTLLRSVVVGTSEAGLKKGSCCCIARY